MRPKPRWDEAVLTNGEGSTDLGPERTPEDRGTSWQTMKSFEADGNYTVVSSTRCYLRGRERRARPV